MSGFDFRQAQVRIVAIISEFTNSVGWKIAVKCRPADIELINDIADEGLVLSIF